MTNRKLFLAIILFIVNYTFGQQYNPDFGEEYIQDYLPSIKITMQEDDYNWMIHPDNIWSSDYQHATATYEGSNGLIINYDDLGIRLRGNTSRSKNKKSFKIHFSKFTDKQYFFGLKKVNLKAETNDPSAVREHMVMNLYRDNNVPSVRVNHIKLYINSNYMGLYSSVEQIDSRFLTSRFNNKSGNLYKCTYGSSNGADLSNLNKVYNNDIYELKTNEDENNRNHLEDFVKFLTTSTDEDFENNIANYINVNNYIKQLAIEILSGHWDGYSYNKNNFYLYYNPEKLWFEYIPYDTDNTLGVDWVSRDWSMRNIYDWARHGDTGRPLYTRLLKSEKYLVKFSRSIDELLKTTFKTEYQMNIANNYKALISDAISSDTYYPKDFGYTIQNFEDSFTKNNVVEHTKYGIKPFITKRSESAREQLDESHLSEINFKINTYYNVFPNPLSGDRILTIDYKNLNRNSIISIKSITGKEVFKSKATSNKIDLNNIKAGIYLININDYTSYHTKFKKLIIN